MQSNRSLSRKAAHSLAPSVALIALIGATGAAAQSEAGPTPLKLDREGYEYDGIRAGNTLLNIETDVHIDFDNNIFRTSADEVEDLRIHINPSVTAFQQFGTGSIEVQTHAEVIRHLDTVRENSTTFGSEVNLGLTPAKGQNFNARVAFNRNIERRGDPETTAGPTDRPRRINVIAGELFYRRAIGDFRIEGQLGTERVNQLAAEDDERDLQTYRAGITLAYRLDSSLDVFVEGFVNRRDFRLATDFSGVDRDTNTYGAVVGVRREIGDKLTGRFGVGVFRTDPEDPVIPQFTGIRLESQLTWFPRTRTAVTFRAERGDVATVRSGATTRIDTITRLRVDQEIRHNILGHAQVSYTERSFRGESRGVLRNVGGQVGLSYLFDRRMSFYTRAQYANRAADLDIDTFKTFELRVGVRRRF